MLILKAQGHSDTAIGAKYGASQRTVAHQLKQAERDIVRLLLVVAPVVKQCLDNMPGGEVPAGCPASEPSVTYVKPLSGYSRFLKSVGGSIKALTPWGSWFR
jgi:hypothetical protein